MPVANAPSASIGLDSTQPCSTSPARPARMSGSGGRSRPWTSTPAASRSGGRTARRASSRPVASSVRTARGRWWRGRPACMPRPGYRPGSVSPTTSPTPIRAPAAMPGCASWTTATSGSPRSRAGGSTSGSCWAGRGRPGSPPMAPGPSPIRSWPPSRRSSATTWRGPPDRRRTPSPARGRSRIA